MGIVGSAWATLIARALMALGMLAFARSAARGSFGLLGIELKHQLELIKLGLPAGLQSTAEAGVFALSTILVGRLDSNSLAAHQIVLNLASMTFMVPLGIGTAAAVTVGYFLGRQDRLQARRQGWTALAYTLAFMACTGIIFWLVGDRLLTIYSQDTAVLKLAIPVLMIAALFQLSDGTQTVLTGALRGWGDTQSAFLANLVGHWAIGLPLGLWLGFSQHRGVFGVWIGLAVGLTCVAASLLWTWHRRSR